jgi:hypothetical protein
VRPTALHRIAAALIAALFVFGGAEHGSGLDPCPHHDAAILVADHHAHHAGSSGGSHSGSEEHGPCACVGPCATPPAAPLPSTASRTVAVAFERVVLSPIPARDIAAPQFVPFLLPYAHAPPSLG